MTEDRKGVRRPDPELLHRIYDLATSMPPRVSFEEMFSGASDEDLQAVIGRLETARGRFGSMFGGPPHSIRGTRHGADDTPAGPSRRQIEKEIAAFGPKDVANLADDHLEKHVERLAPGLLSGSEGRVLLRVRDMRVDGPAGAQQVRARGLMRLNDMVEVLDVVVIGAWNGKEIGFRSMHLA